MCYVYFINDITTFIEHNIIVVHYIIIKYKCMQDKNNRFQKLLEYSHNNII